MVREAAYGFCVTAPASHQALIFAVRRRNPRLPPTRGQARHSWGSFPSQPGTAIVTQLAAEAHSGESCHRALTDRADDLGRDACAVALRDTLAFGGIVGNDSVVAMDGLAARASRRRVGVGPL